MKLEEIQIILWDKDPNEELLRIIRKATIEHVPNGFMLVQLSKWIKVLNLKTKIKSQVILRIYRSTITFISKIAKLNNGFKTEIQIQDQHLVPEVRELWKHFKYRQSQN